MRFRWLAMAGLSAASLWSAAGLIASPAMAQDTKTLELPSLESTGKTSNEVVTVAIAPLDRLLPNITHMMRLVGAGAQSGMINQAVNGYTNGMDRSRPIGAYVTLGEAGVPVTVASLPISDLESFLGGLELFGEAEDLGEGLYSMSIGPNTVFAKEKGDWLFVSSSEESLESLPTDAAGTLETMVAKNDIWLEVNVQNIPDDLIDLLTSQMRSGFEQAMEAQSGDMSDEELENSRASGEQLMGNLEEAIAGTEKFVIGLGIRPKEKTVTLDTGTKFVEGSRFAKQMMELKSAKASLTGAVSDVSMMNLRTYQVVAAEDVAQIEATLDQSLKAAYKAIEDQASDDASAERAKAYLDRLVAILIESSKQGSVESVVSVSTNPSLNILIGFTVADGSQVEALAKDLAGELAGAKAPVKVELMTGTYKGSNLHRLTAPLPEGADDSARKIFGDSVQVAIATAPKSVFLSIGKTAEASLKTALDGVGGSSTLVVDPVRMRFDLTQLLNFIQSVDSNPAVAPIIDGMLSALSSGEDRILLDSKLIERGSIVRLTIQEGVLKAIAGGVRAGMAGQGGGF